MSTLIRKFRLALAVNLTGVFLGCRAIVPLLRQGDAPAICSVSSIDGIRGSLDHSAYAASKGGIASLTRALALELAPDGIRVNAICPGTVDTPMVDGLLQQDAAAGQPRQDKHPLGRISTAEEQAAAAAFLCSPAASFVTGVCLKASTGAARSGERASHPMLTERSMSDIIVRVIASNAPRPALGPLASVVVVDMTTSYAGPTAAMYLADLGATVIKVERPGRGDDTRAWGPPFVDGASAWFASANRNKQSVVLDLRTDAGREALLQVLDNADVFLQNTNPSKLEGLGIDHESLRARNPRLVYCAMSGFGLDGPDSDLPGYDLVAQARSGLMSVTGEKSRSPQRVSTALSDVVTGMCAAIAVSAALVRQQKSGEGEVIDVSLLDSDLALMAPRIAAYAAGEPEPAPSGGTDSVLAVYQPFEAADRTIVVAIGNDLMWQRLCEALELPGLVARADLDDNAARRQHRSEITEQVAERLASRPAEEWLRVLGAADIPVSLVQTLSEVVKDPQVLARRSLMPVPGTRGDLVTVHSPFRLGSIPEPRNERFPELGEHTRSVLAGMGFSAEEIEDLDRSGAVMTAEESRP